MSVDIIIFIAMGIVGISSMVIQELGEKCPWLAYWALYIAHMSHLASEIF